MKMDTEAGSVHAVADDLPDGVIGDPADPPVAAADLLAAVDLTVPPAQVPASYAIGVGLLAGMMVLLPVAYLGLLGFLGWIGVWHAVQSVTSLQYGPYFVFHLPMAVLGILLVVFLIKPVFFRPRRRDDAIIVLEPADEPVLFEAVHKLCTAIGSKRPCRIEVDCEPNAHARYRRAVDSIAGGDLVLRVGLPLAASMSVRQFLGVIAHELGHFTQVRGMTASYLVRRCTGFFTRVVFQKDRIDLAMARMRVRRGPLGRLIYYAVAVFVEPMRGFLWAMATAAELMCCGVLRRMEHDADGVDGHVSGVVDFARTSRLLAFLDLGSRRAHADLSDSYDRGRLADDLPRLIVANARQLAEHRQDLLKMVTGGKTRWFDTHPCYDDRVKHVERVTPADAGLAEPTSAPAGLLFADFPAVCRRATSACYVGILGRKRSDAAQLVRVDELADDQAGRRADMRSLGRYMRGLLVGSRPVFPTAELSVPVADPVVAVEKLGKARQAMKVAADHAGPCAAAIRVADTELPGHRANLLLCGLFPRNPRIDVIRRRAQKGVALHGPVRQDAVAGIANFEQAAAERLTLGLRLLSSDAVAGRLTDAEIVEGHHDLDRLLPVIAAAAECRAAADTLVEQLPVLQSLFGVLNAVRNSPTAQRAVHSALDRCTVSIITAMDQIVEKTRAVVFPFAHASDGITVAATIVPQRPAQRDLRGLFAAGGLAVDRYRDLTFRSLALLTRWVERVEMALGYAPLPEPAPAPAGKQSAKAARGTAGIVRHSARYWFAYGGRAAAGFFMVGGLVHYSINPPTLPPMPWESPGDRDNRYQPAAFGVARVPMIGNAGQGFGRTGPSTFGGYQGRATVGRAGGPVKLMPPGYVPPSYSPPVFSIPGGNTPGGPQQGPNGGGFGPPRGGGGNIGGGSRGGGGGGHR